MPTMEQGFPSSHFVPYYSNPFKLCSDNAYARLGAGEGLCYSWLAPSNSVRRKLGGRDYSGGGSCVGLILYVTCFCTHQQESV